MTLKTILKFMLKLVLKCLKSVVSIHKNKVHFFHQLRRGRCVHDIFYLLFRFVHIVKTGMLSI